MNNLYFYSSSNILKFFLYFIKIIIKYTNKKLKEVINHKNNNFILLGRGSPNIEMDEHTFLVNRERAVDYLCSLEKVPFINSSTASGFLGRNFHPSAVTTRITLVGLSLSDFLPPSVDYWQESTLPSPSLHLRYN